MKTQEALLSDEEFQLQYGMEPTMMDNLKESQQDYLRKGVKMSLAEVYRFEIGPLPLDPVWGD